MEGGRWGGEGGGCGHINRVGSKQTDLLYIYIYIKRVVRVWVSG